MRFREMVQEEEELRVAQSTTGKKFAAKVFDVGSYLLQDITVMQYLVLPSFTKDIFSSPSVVHFSRESVGEIAIFKVFQNLVTGDRYKVCSLISDIDPSEAGKWMSSKVLSRSVIAMLY